MNWSEISTIILAVIAVVAAVGWGVLFTRGRQLWTALQKLRDTYKQAAADGKITDAEKAEIADDLIDIIDHATSVGQVVYNLFSDILGIIIKSKIKQKGK